MVKGSNQFRAQGTLIHIADFGFGPRRNIFYPLLGDGILTQEGVAWQHSRELLKPQFTQHQYQDLEMFRDHVDNLISCLPHHGEPVDLQPLFFRSTLDTTTDLVFGESTYCLKPSDSQREQTFADSFHLAQDYLIRRLQIPGLYFLIGGRRFSEACASVHKFVDDIIERGLQTLADAGKEKPERYLLMDIISQDVQDKVALRYHLISILLAGRDTTACLLSWTL